MPGVALERAEIVLPARGRFDLRATVLSRGPAGLPPYRWRDGAAPVLERAEQLPDGSVHLLAIRPDRRGVVLRVTGRDAREIEVLAPLAARVRRALALDFDPATFQRACAGDRLLRPAARLGLGRVLHGTSAFEDVVGALACSGDAATEGAHPLARLAALGPRCPARPSLRAFPTAAAIARLDEPRLRVRSGLGQRAAWIRALARETARGRRDLLAIDTLSMAAAQRALTGVRGLGPVGVAQVLLLLGHHDRPVLEPAAPVFARRALGGGGAQLDRWLRRHRPWRGLALWFALWLESPAAQALTTARARGRPGRRAAGS
jgi:3-methyladenine DNA glycosylase/8-oxoguanine DNA glycosylase